jgi:ABC-type polysaccharide/polyol phosphate transport system ATPase subunit
VSADVGALIAFEGVSKRFLRGRRYSSLGDLIPAAFRRVTGRARGRREEFWALRDVSFSVDAGHALGIIGPNGSGKSTTLKLITGILRPDRGRVIVRAPRHGRGRIGALIELSAGFHYELSGRDNVYLQGALLGMRRAEVARKFDEIVGFAELAEFIDSPVKHYSTGMVARLGFAIAAHLEPDILLIDEVLAVGDLAFQQRAFGRIEELVRRGVPAVVVSHQLNQVMQLCDQAVLLSHGAVICSGTAAECVARYVSEAAPPEEHTDSPIRLSEIAGPFPSQVAPGDRVRLRLCGMVAQPGDGARITVGVRVRALPREELVFVAHSAGCDLAMPPSGPFELEIELQMNVGPGSYRAQAAAWDLRDLREIARGPSTLIGVGPHAAASGMVFAAPRMRFLSE